jgi:uncharacterized protein
VDQACGDDGTIPPPPGLSRQHTDLRSYRRITEVHRSGPTFNDAAPPPYAWPEPRLTTRPNGTVVPRAFDQFVVKLHSRCNLACDYCSIYELQDSGWRSRPRTMPAPVRDQVVARIAEHARRHRLAEVRVILHGGEPLLAGAAVIGRFATAVRQALRGSGATAHLVVQSNGTLLGDAMLETLARHDIRIGVSLDGGQEAHDRHRRRAGRPAGRAGTAPGAGSHQDVVRALERLRRPGYRGLFDGLLCTVDTANDPVRCYDALASHDPPSIDFLLPHGTWDQPPPGARAGQVPYGRWLVAAFDRWWQTGRAHRVRLFESLVGLCEDGTGAGSEVTGTVPAAALMVESDGSVAWTDALKAVADGAADTGATIFSHSFDAVLALPDAPEYGTASLCHECQACPVREVCGGGMRAHRFGRDRGFDNPTVYCADLQHLIGHVRTRLDAGAHSGALPHTPARTWEKSSRLPHSAELAPNDVFWGTTAGNSP